MAEFDPANFSTRPSDKLQAVLNYGWEGAGNYLPREYLEACAKWFRSLSASDMVVAVTVMRSHSSGDEAAAMKAASELPPAPKCPL
jgi:hypothetical protein